MNKKKEIRFYVCKECGGAIENGLCGYECSQDGVDISKRSPENVEIHIYKLDRVEPYQKTTSA